MEVRPRDSGRIALSVAMLRRGVRRTSGKGFVGVTIALALVGGTYGVASATAQARPQHDHGRDHHSGLRWDMRGRGSWVVCPMIPAGTDALKLPPIPEEERGFGGLITAIGSNSITFTTPEGVSETVDVDSSTIFRNDDQKISFSDLTAGEDVEVVAPRMEVEPESSTTTSAPAGSTDQSTTTSTTSPVPIARLVVVVGPELEGWVEATATGSFVLQDPQGFRFTVDTSSSTVYSERGVSPAPTSVAVGDVVLVKGVLNLSDYSTLNATSVWIIPQKPVKGCCGPWRGKGPRIDMEGDSSMVVCASIGSGTSSSSSTSTTSTTTTTTQASGGSSS